MSERINYLTVDSTNGKLTMGELLIVLPGQLSNEGEDFIRELARKKLDELWDEIPLKYRDYGLWLDTLGRDA